MTASTTQHDQRLVRQLLGAVRPGAGRGPVDAVDYDWLSPHRFLPAQLERLNDFAARAARAVARDLGALLRTDTTLAPAPVTEHYAQRLRESLGEGPGLYAPVSSGGNGCGAIALSATGATAWVQRLLGGSDEKDDAGRELSEVETELLQDIVGAVIKGISAAAQEIGGGAFTAGPGVGKGSVDLPGDASREYCQMCFHAGDPAEAPAVSLLLLADVAEAVIDGGDKARGAASADQTRQHMLAHVAGTPIQATCWLGSAEVSMGDVLALEPGDVLLTGRSIDEPGELEVQGKVILSGSPAQRAGQYALRVVATGGRPGKG